MTRGKMTSNFYATLAQVLPVLLLALMWDSAFLVRLRRQQRLPRRVDPGGVRFWTKSRVRVYTLAVAGEVIISLAVTMLVLAGLVPDSRALRMTLMAGLMLLLATLLTRLSVDIIRATTVTTDASAQEARVSTTSRIALEGSQAEETLGG
jgi:hypothetical protein